MCFLYANPEGFFMDVMLPQLDGSSVIEGMRQQKTPTAPSALSTIASGGYKRAAITTDQGVLLRRTFGPRV